MEEKVKRVRVYSEEERERRREAERKRMEDPEYRASKRARERLRMENKEVRERKRAIDRERQRREDVAVRKLEAARKYRETQRFKELEKQRAEMISAKKRVDYIEKRVGSMCEVLLINCPICTKIEVKKRPPNNGHSAMNCCSSCARVNPWHRMKQPEKNVTCNDCGEVFKGKSKRLYCDVCRDARRIANEAKYQRMYGADMESRARKKGVLREKVSKDVVFARDGWKCCDCGISVVRSRHYQLNQASVDHIVPLSRGGSHTYSNVRTLCVPCNTAKADRLIGEYVVGLTSTGRRVGYANRGMLLRDNQ